LNGFTTSSKTGMIGPNHHGILDRRYEIVIRKFCGDHLRIFNSAKAATGLICSSKHENRFPTIRHMPKLWDFCARRKRTRAFAGEPCPAFRRQHVATSLDTHALSSGPTLPRFNFELQVLVIAELVGTAYYQLLKLRTPDPVLESACGLLLRDEARHIQFHIEWLGSVQSPWLPLEQQVWTLQFQLLFTAAANVAWFDHREALKLTGACRKEFSLLARAQRIAFLRQLEAQGDDAKPMAKPRLA
jgi:hypothetical protein